MPPRTYDWRKNPRKCGTKVRSGCRTCKIRHIKCDEQKPECLKCKSTGRKCDGYGAVVEYTSNLNTYHVSVVLPGNQQERRQFAFFRACTSPVLSGAFDEGMLERLMLQCSLQIPALRHAVVALASLHENYKDSKEQRRNDQDDLKSIWAIQQYTKALGHLSKDLAEGRRNSIFTLMTCTVLIAFDSVRGQLDSSLVHLRSGMQIVAHLLKTDTLGSSDAYFIQKSLIPLLKRQWIQAVFFVNTRDPGEVNEVWSDWLEKTMINPTAFTTLEEARSSLNSHIDNTLHVFFTIEKSCTLELELSQSKKLADALDLWEERFNAFTKTRTSTLSSKDIRAETLLKILHITIDTQMKISVHAASQNGVSLSGIQSRFEQILQLSRKLITAEHSLPGLESSTPTLTFSPDVGLIAPLYFVAVKCPVPHLRWEAVSLLRLSKRREGLWDSELVARVCSRVIYLDQAHDTGIEDTEHIDIETILNTGPMKRLEEKKREKNDTGGWRGVDWFAEIERHYCSLKYARRSLNSFYHSF